MYFTLLSVRTLNEVYWQAYAAYLTEHVQYDADSSVATAAAMLLKPSQQNTGVNGCHSACWCVE